jgi:hypothetical protein
MKTTIAASFGWLAALGVAWLAVAAPALTPARAEDGVVRIGIITDISGQ